MRDLWQAFRTSLRVTGWLFGTVFLGVRLWWRLLRFAWHWPELVAETRPCPRGHEVAVMGTWRCRCGGSFDGWCFARCPICHASAAWTPCPICGLPVKRPLV